MVTDDTIDDVPKAALTMGIPRNRAVRRAKVEVDPLVAECTADTVGFKLSNIWAIVEVLNVFLFGTLGPPALRGIEGGPEEIDSEE